MSISKVMQFILEICDPKTECIVKDVPVEFTHLHELSAVLGIADFDVHAVYELEKDEIERIRKRFNLNFDADAVLVRFRPRRELDDLPYQIHTNRELILMLAGTKPLSVFSGTYPPCPDLEEIPERLFDPYVAEGRFIKREYVDLRDHGRSHRIRRVLYSLPSEVWRIDAYILLQHVACKTGWGEGFERMEGALLGYTEWQNDAYTEWTKRKRKIK